MKNKWKLRINCSAFKFWKTKKEYGYTQYELYFIPTLSLNYYHDPLQDDKFRETPIITFEWLFWSISLWGEKKMEDN